jgi:hypothetical protein
VPNWAFQLLLFAGVLTLQVFGYVVGGLGCGDDGPVDYGTASGLQRSFCRHNGLGDPYHELHPFLFLAPIAVFAIAQFVPRIRGGLKPLVLAAPFIGVSSLPPLVVFAPWAVLLVGIPLAAVAVAVRRRKDEAL